MSIQVAGSVPVTPDRRWPYHYETMIAAALLVVRHERFTVSDLAGIIGIPRQTAHERVRRLANRGLVVNGRTPSEKRLTRDGWESVSEMVAEIEAAISAREEANA